MHCKNGMRDYWSSHLPLPKQHHSFQCNKFFLFSLFLSPQISFSLNLRLLFCFVTAAIHPKQAHLQCELLELGGSFSKDSFVHYANITFTRISVGKRKYSAGEKQAHFREKRKQTSLSVQQRTTSGGHELIRLRNHWT